MLENLSMGELNNWIAYYSVELFPDDERRLENARLLHLLANINSKKKIPLEKFLLKYWDDEPAKVTNVPLQIEMITKMLGGKDLREKK